MGHSFYWNRWNQRLLINLTQANNISVLKIVQKTIHRAYIKTSDSLIFTNKYYRQNIVNRCPWKLNKFTNDVRFSLRVEFSNVCDQSNEIYMKTLLNLKQLSMQTLLKITWTMVTLTHVYTHTYTDKRTK